MKVLGSFFPVIFVVAPCSFLLLDRIGYDMIWYDMNLFLNNYWWASFKSDQYKLHRRFRLKYESKLFISWLVVGACERQPRWCFSSTGIPLIRPKLILLVSVFRCSIRSRAIASKGPASIPSNLIEFLSYQQSVDPARLSAACIICKLREWPMLSRSSSSLFARAIVLQYFFFE